MSRWVADVWGLTLCVSLYKSRQRMKNRPILPTANVHQCNLCCSLFPGILTAWLTAAIFKEQQYARKYKTSTIFPNTQSVHLFDSMTSYSLAEAIAHGIFLDERITNVVKKKDGDYSRRHLHLLLFGQIYCFFLSFGIIFSWLTWFCLIGCSETGHSDPRQTSVTRCLTINAFPGFDSAG